MLSRAKDGRSRARECFQTAPSLEKIELPSRGMKVARRAWGVLNVSLSACLLGYLFNSRHLPVLFRIPRD